MRRPHRHPLYALACALALTLTLAPRAPAEEKSEGKAEGKSEGKSEGKGEAKPEGHAEAKPEAPKPVTASGHYVQSWVPMPAFTATRVGGSAEQETVEPIKGRLLVVIFLASWCEPCQQLMPEVQRIEAHFQRLPVDFVYVFAHDTREDAAGFMKEFNLSRGYLTNQEVLKTYHNPELPSIYVGDRHSWLMKRFLKTTMPDLAKLDGYLKTLASY